MLTSPYSDGDNDTHRLPDGSMCLLDILKPISSSIESPKQEELGHEVDAAQLPEQPLQRNDSSRVDDDDGGFSFDNHAEHPLACGNEEVSDVKCDQLVEASSSTATPALDDDSSDASSSQGDADTTSPEFAANNVLISKQLRKEFQDFEEQMATLETECHSMSISSNCQESHVSQTQHHREMYESTGDAVHKAYAELYEAVPMHMVEKMRSALQGVPQVTMNT